jgi:hypothetical protein
MKQDIICVEKDDDFERIKRENEGKTVEELDAEFEKFKEEFKIRHKKDAENG